MSKLILPEHLKPKVETERETLPVDNKAAESIYSIRRSGECMKPHRAKYIGSAVIHYYDAEGTEETYRHQVITQCLVETVPEGFADFGHKELQKALMKAFGREVN